MSVPPELIAIIRGWILKAEEDYDVALHEFNRGNETPYGVVCFHVQQAVEKYMKGLLVYRSIEFPKTHDLLAIHALMPTDLNIKAGESDLSRVSRFAVEPRYPEIFEQFGIVDARWAVDFMVKMRDEIRAKLPPEALVPKKS